MWLPLVSPISVHVEADAFEIRAHDLSVLVPVTVRFPAVDVAIRIGDGDDVEVL